LNTNKLFNNIDEFLKNKTNKNSDIEMVLLPVCEIGKERSKLTGRCIKAPKNNQARNPRTNRLYNLI
jgi:hypothetical protein